MDGINFYDNDFIIGQDTTGDGTTDLEIIKIYKTEQVSTGGDPVDTGDLPARKVEIKNSKTYIEDLDFGG